MSKDCRKHTTRSRKQSLYSCSSGDAGLAERGKIDHRKDWPHFSTAAKDNCAIGRGRVWNPAGNILVITAVEIKHEQLESTSNLKCPCSCMSGHKMPSDGDSFLPRIQSVFYAVFDLDKGPRIIYQVPEGLIGVSPPSLGSVPPSPLQSTPSSDVDFNLSSPRNSTEVSLHKRTTSRSFPSPQKRSTESSRMLFNFDEISKYIIPRSALCGRLVICAARKYRIIGFPVKLRGNYRRFYFIYNLCFVFERSADLSCYEPIVRKVSRVLSACEEEFSFLSSPATSCAVHVILEQLYEDLNSYSETHIPIDQPNSIELKIFPFYPNPPAVKDWMVPLALINLKSRIEANWDLTLAKVCQFIDGTNHVSRIAHLADCDLDLTRQAISHLLYYQVIMTIDIFQYSNMYTLRKSIQWLADEAHVREECGLYVTKPGREIPDWPKLLHLYSRLKPGLTVFEWMEAFQVHNLGVDVRRFTSFGVIKGFLRRVHRWPVLLPENRLQAKPWDDVLVGTKGGSHLSVVASPQSSEMAKTDQFRFQAQQITPLAFIDTELAGASTKQDGLSAPHNSRRTSIAETVLEQVRSKDLQKSGVSPVSSTWVHHESHDNTNRGGSNSRRHSLTSPTLHSQTLASLGTIGAQPTRKSSLTTIQHTPRIRPSRSSSHSSFIQTTSPASTLPYPPELLPLLDGEHHTDELATRFGAGWPLLKQWLIAVGGGIEDGDFGRVSIIHR